MKLTIPRLFLFVILFFTISQLGKHFWPYTAYVSGIRVDYLSPTLYFTDLLVAGLFVYTVPSLVRLTRKSHKPSLLILFTTLILSISIIVSKYPISALYGVIKTIEMIFLGYMVSRHFNNKSGYFTACVMSSAMIIECTLVLLQMITKASIGGIWYFLGERTFSIGNIGISTVSALGQEWLRAYGSFPHPNVLAFFLLFGLVFVVHGLRNTNRKTKGFFYLSFVLGSLCLLLTYSRLVILLYLIFCIVNAIQYTQLRKTFVSITIILSVFILFFFQRFGYEMIFSSDLYYRIDLAKIALKIISEYPLFGVGLNNYFYYQIDYQRMVTPVLLQPPHSIYLISLLNFGIIGGIFFLYLLYKTIIRAYWHLKHMRNSMQYTGSLLFIALLIVGFADHYFVTLQQGLLLMTYILGIIWIPKAKEWV